MTTVLNTLQEILLDKVAYDTDIPVHELKAEPKFWSYWLEYLETDDDTWRLDSVIEYALELAYGGSFSDNLWEVN
jgi:hypothetical protein